MLNVCGNVNRLDLLQRELALLAPIRKPRDRDEVRLAGIPVADVGSKKFPKAFASFLGTQKQRRHAAGRSADRGEMAGGSGAKIVVGDGHRINI